MASTRAIAGGQRASGSPETEGVDRLIQLRRQLSLIPEIAGQLSHGLVALRGRLNSWPAGLRRVRTGHTDASPRWLPPRCRCPEERGMLRRRRSARSRVARATRAQQHLRRSVGGISSSLHTSSLVTPAGRSALYHGRGTRAEHPRRHLNGSWPTLAGLATPPVSPAELQLRPTGWPRDGARGRLAG